MTTTTAPRETLGDRLAREHGHSAEVLCAECLHAIGVSPTSQEQVRAQRLQRAVVISALDVTMQAPSWLWHGRIPEGHITIIDGDPGVGKSTMLLDIAARASRGVPMPGATAAHPA